ncbi:unnamed protein product [Cylicostephanus goldi]|uniref:Reverse transcriptase domain-containing protein n=1 Tax=Cylicostephanus goldi TaxID=71465 RepID=A0A3P7PI08_CYLGO|nr:unnamed protein product [Cylicostephanus goldi]
MERGHYYSNSPLLQQFQRNLIQGASTVTSLADSLFDWTVALNNNQAADNIYVDLSKAFGVVCRKLVMKLRSLGISDNLLAWLESYLETEV